MGELEGYRGQRRKVSGKEMIYFQWNISWINPDFHTEHSYMALWLFRLVPVEKREEGVLLFTGGAYFIPGASEGDNSACNSQYIFRNMDFVYCSLLFNFYFKTFSQECTYTVFGSYFVRTTVWWTPKVIFNSIWILSLYLFVILRCCIINSK